MRAGAVLSGAVGLAAVAAGFVGVAVTPDAEVTVSSALDTPVVVIPPRVLALDGLQDVTIEATAVLDTSTARPVDAFAWIRGARSSVVQGLASWDDVEVLVPGIYADDGSTFGGDIWRTQRRSWGESVVVPSAIEPGAAVVVVAEDGARLERVSIRVTRDPGVDWAWPAVSAGAMLGAFALILFAVDWLGLRPARPRQARADAEIAATEATPVRKDGGTAPTSRRARREAAQESPRKREVQP